MKNARVCISLLIAFVWCAKSHAAAEPCPTPHGAETIRLFLKDRTFMHGELVGVLAQVESVVRDEQQRPICKIKVDDYSDPLWAVFIIQAPWIKVVKGFGFFVFWGGGEYLGCGSFGCPQEVSSVLNFVYFVNTATKRRLLGVLGRVGGLVEGQFPAPPPKIKNQPPTRGGGAGCIFWGLNWAAAGYFVSGLESALVSSAIALQLNFSSARFLPALPNFSRRCRSFIN